jgi:tellurite resistance-related uncharacterized protein
MKSLPTHVEKYANSPEFAETTIPKNLLSEHATKQGVWGRLVVKSGALTYTILGDTQESIRLEGGDFGVIEPTTGHFVKPDGAVTFLIEFYR